MRPDKTLLPFQKEIVKEIHEGTRKQVLYTAPRGSGKTFLAAHIIADLIWDQSPHYQKGKEVVVVAGSVQQAGLIMKDLAWMAEAKQYSFSDGLQVKQIVHYRHRTSMRVVSSKATTALGLGANQSLIVADEASSWGAREGELMHQALKYSLGKPDSNTKILWISTIAPDICQFFGRMVQEGDSKHIKTFIYKLDKEEDWDNPKEVLRINPLKAHFEDSKQYLLEELEEAKNDYGKSVNFKNWALNFNTANESEVLLTTPQVVKLLENKAPPREGNFVVGLDLADNTAFSAAAAVWENGRVEGFAACSGYPKIAERERNDARPAGTYQKLVDQNELVIAEGKNTTPLQWFLDLVKDRFGGEPFAVAADQYRRRELKDLCDWYLQFKRTNTAEAANFGIQAFKQYCAEGVLALDPKMHSLFVLSIADARLETDSSGLAKTVKKNADNTGRDDLAHAIILACDLYKEKFDLQGGTPAMITL